MDGTVEHGHMGGSTESDDTTLFAGFLVFQTVEHGVWRTGSLRHT